MRSYFFLQSSNAFMLLIIYIFIMRWWITINDKGKQNLDIIDYLLFFWLSELADNSELLVGSKLSEFNNPFCSTSKELHFASASIFFAKFALYVSGTACSALSNVSCSASVCAVFASNAASLISQSDVQLSVSELSDRRLSSLPFGFELILSTCDSLMLFLMTSCAVDPFSFPRLDSETTLRLKNEWHFLSDFDLSTSIVFLRYLCLHFFFGLSTTTLARLSVEQHVFGAHSTLWHSNRHLVDADRSADSVLGMNSGWIVTMVMPWSWKKFSKESLISTYTCVDEKWKRLINASCRLILFFYFMVVLLCINHKLDNQ